MGKVFYRIFGGFTGSESVIYVGAIAWLLIAGKWQWAAGAAIAGPVLVEVQDQLAERSAQRRNRRQND